MKTEYEKCFNDTKFHVDKNVKRLKFALLPAWEEEGKRGEKGGRRREKNRRKRKREEEEEEEGGRKEQV